MSHTGIKSVEPGMFEPQSLCPESGGIWRGMSIRPAFNSRRLSRSSARIFSRSSYVHLAECAG
jgi:hypothetical protein